MSGAFHAYRNIGFSFVKTEATCRQWRTKFTDYDPSEAVRYGGVRLDDRYVLVEYLGKMYRLDPALGILEKETDEGWSEDLNMNEALVVYHFLGDRKPQATLSGIWVPENTLDPVAIRTGDRTDPILKGFAREYQGRLSALDAQCVRAGGAAVKTSGDGAWEFRPFPEIPMRLVFWDADEDFPAQMQVLVDRNATDFVHYEALGFIMADVFVKISGTA